MEPNENEEAPPATERQRTALLHWGVDRDRAEDPGLTRTQASKWLGALIAAKKGENGESPGPPKGSTPRDEEARPPGPIPPAEVAGTDASPPTLPTDPDFLEVEITAPTALPYTGVRLRTRASRGPRETLAQLGDRLADQLAALARRETQRVEEALRPTVRPDPRPKGPANGRKLPPGSA